MTTGMTTAHGVYSAGCTGTEGLATVDDVIWSCPDCDGDLERDSYGLWCPRCEQVVPYACLPADPDPEPYWGRL